MPYWDLETDNICIGIPYATVTSQCTITWALKLNNLIKPQGTRIFTSAGQPIDSARNSIVDMFLNTNSEYLFFLDTDVIVPEDTIIKLMNHNLDIVSALYFTRTPPIEPCCWKDDLNSIYRAKPIKFEIGQLIEAEIIGMGACLINRRVFENIDKPYYLWTLGKEDNGVSEDFYFCRKAREKGFKIFCDTSIIGKHVSLCVSEPSGLIIRSLNEI